MDELFKGTELKTCVICGMPFKPYSRRQKTCGDPDCQKTYKRDYTNRWASEFKERDPEGWKRYHREAMRRYRRKTKAAEERDEQLQELQDHWERVEEFDDKISRIGLSYGEYQMQKTLAKVPKINVELGGKKDDTVRSEDDD